MTIWKIPFRWYVFAFFFGSSIVCIRLYLKAIYLGGNFTVFELNFAVVGSLGFTLNMILLALVGEVVWVIQIMLNSSILIFPVSPRLNISNYWVFSIVHFRVMSGLMYYFNKNQKL